MKQKINNWKECCHHCHRTTSVAGKISNDGLCSLCHKNGRVATW
jgi:uncharacterized paraquat-inducible protein A